MAAGSEPVPAWNDNVGWEWAELEPGSVSRGLDSTKWGNHGAGGGAQASKRCKADEGRLDETGWWEGGPPAKGEGRGSSRGRAGAGLVDELVRGNPVARSARRGQRSRMGVAGFEPASASARPDKRTAGFETVSAWSDDSRWGGAELEPEEW